MVTKSFSLCFHSLFFFFFLVYLETREAFAGFPDVFHPVEEGIADGEPPEMQVTFLYKR